uniref:RanBP2-type domain-containing protein n=1 Tax=Acrobeloides nanus TaxID=290746 RepID=A0A914DX66_9BILA
MATKVYRHWKQGDWICTECGEKVKKRRTQCFYCKAPKPDVMSDIRKKVPYFLPPQQGSKVIPGTHPAPIIIPASQDQLRTKVIQIRPGHFGGHNLRLGEWICLCGEKVRAHRSECFFCKHPKPIVNSMTVVEELLEEEDEEEEMSETKNLAAPNIIRALPRPNIIPVKPGYFMGHNLRPGEWICLCGEKVRAHRSECFFCKHPKPVVNSVPNLDVVVPNHDTIFVLKTQCFFCKKPKPKRMLQPVAIPEVNKLMSIRGKKHVLRPGEWICPKCGEKVRVNKTSCFFCKNPKPDNVAVGLGPVYVPGAAVVESSSEEEEDEEVGTSRKRKTEPRKRHPKPVITTSNVEEEIRSQMANPTQKILHCETCHGIPIGDEKMMDTHLATKAHRHKEFIQLAEVQAKDPKIGAWHHRISHREYWYANYWTPPCNEFFTATDRAGNDWGWGSGPG